MKEEAKYDFKPGTTLSEDGIMQITRFYSSAILIGSATTEYMLRIIETGRMEKRILQSCKALLFLRLAYSNDRLEKACARGLKSSKYNYNTIKNILLNHLEQLHTESQVNPGKPNLPDTLQAPHENLRGASSFDI